VIYEHLGDTYKELGETKKAIRSYMKAARLDPDNGTIREKIEQLRGKK